jgi:NADP-dependent 3-hydroxy acid dehydrogenase YdfG
MNAITILGSGPNLGEAIARRFGREGWKVILVARNSERLAREVAALKTENYAISGLACDVTDFVALDRLMRSDAIGTPDVLVYNAAVIRPVRLVDQDLDTIGPDLLTNVGGAMVAARAAIPAMVRRGSGKIIFSGGLVGSDPRPSLASLGVGKAGLRNLALGLAKDPDCAVLNIANVTIAAHITADVAMQIAEFYWQLQQTSVENWSPDLRFEAAR